MQRRTPEQQKKYDLVVEMIQKGKTNLQIRKITNYSERYIANIRHNLPLELDINWERRNYNSVPAIFWDEWEAEIFRLFGGSRKIYLRSIKEIERMKAKR